jgi:hypothetical protein
MFRHSFFDTDGDMMSNSRLTPLQQKILVCPAQMDPPWTLVGGAALAGFHLHHRTTRDLDLFWFLSVSAFHASLLRLVDLFKIKRKLSILRWEHSLRV